MTSAPDGLSVFSTYNGLCLRINWRVVDDASSYRLYRAETIYDEFSLIATLATPAGITYFDKPTQPNDNVDLRYYYQVSAIVGLTETAWSGPATYIDYGAFDNDPVPHLSWSSLF